MKKTKEEISKDKEQMERYYDCKINELKERLAGMEKVLEEKNKTMVVYVDMFERAETERKYLIENILQMLKGKTEGA